MKNNYPSFFLLLCICLLFQDCRKWPVYKANLNATVCDAPVNNTCDWMNRVLQAHPDRPVAMINICLPASHDAAMYVLQHCTVFANTGNTQTQYLPMKQQLEAGLRLFDIRPSYFENEFYTEHSMHCDGYGCKGDKLKNVFSATKQFLDSHAEIVIIDLTHFCHTSASDTALLSLLYTTLGDRIYREVTPNVLPLIQTPLQNILGIHATTGKVILLLEGVDNSAANKAKGLFNESILNTNGGWTNDNDCALLKEHQLSNFAKYTGNGGSLFVMAWQYTQHDAQALHNAFVPHAECAIRYGAHDINLALPIMLDSLVKCGAIHAGKIPNILWSDFADTTVVHQCMRLNRVSLGDKQD